jgi:hypothetical protein
MQRRVKLAVTPHFVPLESAVSSSAGMIMSRTKTKGSGGSGKMSSSSERGAPSPSAGGAPLPSGVVSPSPCEAGTPLACGQALHRLLAQRELEPRRGTVSTCAGAPSESSPSLPSFSLFTVYGAIRRPLFLPLPLDWAMISSWYSG